MERIKRILILRSGALGETIFALPVLEALRLQYGEDIEVDWIGTPAASALFALDPRVNHVFHLKHRKLPIWVSSEKRSIIRHSQEHPYDLFINLESGSIFYPLAEKINAKQKVGMPYNQIRPFAGAHVIDSLKTLYETLISPDILQASYPVLYGEPWENVREKFELSGHYIVINPSTSHHQKFTHRAWPNAHWIELIRRLCVRYNIVVIGGKGEEAFFDQLRPFPTGTIDLVGKTSLSELITVIRHADAIVTADTGPSHIASAVNTCAFALFGPSNPVGTGPYPTPFNEVRILSAHLSCSPCNATPRMKACQDNQCMKQIVPEQVVSAIDSFFNQKKAILDQ